MVQSRKYLTYMMGHIPEHYKKSIEQAHRAYCLSRSVCTTARRAVFGVLSLENTVVKPKFVQNGCCSSSSDCTPWRELLEPGEPFLWLVWCRPQWKGLEEAKRGAQAIKDAGMKFDVCYTSVLKRAIKTLWTIMEVTDQMWLPVVRTWRLNERHSVVWLVWTKQRRQPSTERSRSRSGADHWYSPSSYG